MALDPTVNFGKVEVSTGYDASATSIVLASGDGAKLPSTFSYNVTWWNFTDYPDPSDDPNVEIVRVTARTTDTLTVTRGQEGISATTKNTASKTYKMVLSQTKKTIDDIETDIATKISANSTDTLTNKTFDANGTGNSLSNVDVADLADGTDGELITWSAAGVAATVAVGTATQVLTSNGAGAAPTMQDAAGGGGFPTNVFTQGPATLSATTNYTFTHNLGVTEADVIAGKYKVVITGTISANTGAQFGDTYGSNTYWGNASAAGPPSVVHLWNASPPTSQGQVRWQTNDARIDIGATGLTNAVFIIQQMY